MSCSTWRCIFFEQMIRFLQHEHFVWNGCSIFFKQMIYFSTERVVNPRCFDRRFVWIMMTPPSNICREGLSWQNCIPTLSLLEPIITYTIGICYCFCVFFWFSEFCVWSSLIVSHCCLMASTGFESLWHTLICFQKVWECQRLAKQRLRTIWRYQISIIDQELPII